jgi:hypothetical protein
MLATDGKWLAWRSTGDEIGPALPSAEILMMHVALNQWPMANQIISTSLVYTDRFAGIMVVFEYGIVLKTCIGCGKRKPTRTREKLDTT